MPETSNKIKEATGGAGLKFEVVVLQEGLGNFKDAYYYTKPALESLCRIAEGKKIFANHPTATEENDQPERDVLKAFGHYENFRVQEADGGRNECVADLVMCEGEAFDRERGLVQHAVKYAEKYKNQDFVGVSIYAAGDSEEMALDDLIRQGVPQGCMEKLSQAKDLGVDRVKVAKNFTDCTSIDLVTEAGAGGRISKMLESQRKGKNQMAKEKTKKETENEAVPPKADPKADPATDPNHPDKDQDVALVKSLLDKYHGKDSGGAPGKTAPVAGKPADGGGDKDGTAVVAGSENEGESENESEAEAEAELGKKLKAAYQAAKKMGHEGEAAEAEAVKHVKMAAEVEAEAERCKQAEAEKAEAEKKESEKAEAEVEKGKKEAAKTIVKLQGELSAMREKLAKIELESHIDKTLAESHIPMAATKKFKESIGVVKSKAEFDRLFKVFTDAREVHSGGEAASDFSEAYVNPERESVPTTDSGSELDFAGACAD